jgi:hypothetical protein
VVTCWVRQLNASKISTSIACRLSRNATPGIVHSHLNLHLMGMAANTENSAASNPASHLGQVTGNGARVTASASRLCTPGSALLRGLPVLHEYSTTLLPSLCTSDCVYSDDRSQWPSLAQSETLMPGNDIILASLWQG